MKIIKKDSHLDPGDYIETSDLWHKLFEVRAEAENLAQSMEKLHALWDKIPDRIKECLDFEIVWTPSDGPESGDF